MTTYRIIPKFHLGRSCFAIVGTDTDGSQHDARYCETHEEAERIAGELDRLYGPMRPPRPLPETGQRSVDTAAEIGR